MITLIDNFFSVVGCLILISVVGGMLSVPIFSILRLISTPFRKEESVPSKTLDRLYWTSLILALFASTFLLFGEQISDSIQGEPQYPIEFISAPDTIGRNQTAFVEIKGAPNTEYSITVTYSSGPSKAAGLYPKLTDSEGFVSWRWKIGGRTNYGRYPITITGGGSKETIYFHVG